MAVASSTAVLWRYENSTAVEDDIMEAFFNWLSTNPVAATVFIVALGLLIISANLIYLTAFLQGREISFWPPKIGPRPIKVQPNDAVSLAGAEDAAVVSVSHSNGNPIVGKGSVLQTASGKTLTIHSNFYGGAYATLFRATNAASDEPLIVKVYWRGLMPASPAWHLFNQEQRTAEILEHRNIVKTYDRGLFGGYPFTVMEYFEGGTLRDWLRTHDRMRGSDILSIARQVADAVDFAHSHGVIHRDIKPGNILFESSPTGRVALGDFGIARILGAVEQDITAVGGDFVGSPGYLAPEAFKHVEVTASSDIYSFATVLFEMLAGRPPFEETQKIFALIDTKLHQDAPGIREFRPDVPKTVAARIADSLSRIPSDRPVTANALLSGLEKHFAQL